MSTDSKPDPATTLFEAITSRFEKAFARGWKHKLAEVLGVPDTTVQGWLKAGRFSPAVDHRIGAMLAAGRFRRRLSGLHDAWMALRAVDEVIESTDGTFLVAERAKSGELKVLASGLRDRATAERFAQARALALVADWQEEVMLREAGAIDGPSPESGPLGEIDLPVAATNNVVPSSRSWVQIDTSISSVPGQLDDVGLSAADELNSDLEGWLRHELAPEDYEAMMKSGAFGVWLQV